MERCLGQEIIEGIIFISLFQNKYLQIFGPGTFNLQNIRYFSRRHYVRFTDDFYFSKMTLSSQLNNILNRENVLKLFCSKKIKEDFEMLYPAKVFKISTATQAKELLEKVAGC